MIQTTPGQLSPHVHFIGNRLICNFLVIAEKQMILLDAGMTISALLLERQIRSFADYRLHDIFLTHSHYDHLGSVPYLQKKYRGIKIWAHPIVKDVLANPKAVQLIRSLNEESEKRYMKQESLPKEARFEPFTIDYELQDGERIKFAGDVTIQTIYTPGHTRDSLSFYIRPDRVLYGGDGLGVPTKTGFIQATFLSNYHDYLKSLNKLQELSIETLCLPHAGVIQGKKEVETHLSRSIEEAVSLRERIKKYLKIFNNDIEKVTNKITEEDYDLHKIEQPIEAFLINLKSMVVRTYKDIQE